MAILTSTSCDIWSSHMLLLRIQIFWDMTLYHWVNGSSRIKELNAFNFKDQALQEGFLTLQCRYYVPSKCQNPLALQHSATSH